jgi:6-phosphogluconolactonase (cycloisomerase 2 family)
MQIGKSAHRTPVRNKPDWAILAAGLITIGLFAASVVGGATESASSPQDTSRLVSVQHLPGNMNLCTVDESAATNPDVSAPSPEEDNLFSALKAEPSIFMAAQGGRVPNTEKEEEEAAEARAHGARTPVRTIRDTAPTYSAVAVDANSSEVILQDNNLWQYLVFDRLSPTPAGPNDISQPKRTVRGDKTLLQFNNGLYVDPNGDIFSVESDTGDRMVRFPRDASGDVPPKAVLHTPHRVYNLAADESTQEIFATIEYPPQVVVYRKDASGEEKPLRAIQGDSTRLDSPHGIAVDEKDRLLFVNTWGHHSDVAVAGTGKWLPPAIEVYALDASGDAKPLRVITGDQTQLDWPAAMKFNPENGDLYVANDIGQSILVFGNAPKADGDVAPARAIHGPSTRLRNPTGVALDLKNKEVWVSNLGNSSAAVYPLMANGDVAPLRIIRSAEESKRGVNFGRTAAVTYDPIRQEILVPN